AAAEGAARGPRRAGRRGLPARPPGQRRRDARLMPRYRLLIEYDGRPYHGFQAQGALPSIQGCIERAVQAFCGQTLRLQAAGRTDTGVHATGQVIHVDLAKDWRPEVVRDALNAHLVPEPIVVL